MNAQGSSNKIYWRLRDPTTPWSDRTKLFRYAWKYKSVHLPNKHQVLLDWLTLSLTGKKRVAPAEAAGPWQCLCDVLWSRQCQSGVGTKNVLTIKTVVAQFLVEELQSCLRKCENASCGADINIIISCIEALLKSSILQHVFTSRLDIMIQTLAVTSSLCSQDLERDSSVSTQKAALLTLLLQILGQTQWRRVNLQQILKVTTTSLLYSAADFLAQLTHQKESTDLSTEKAQLSQFVCNALFHAELWEHYQLYVGVKVKSSKMTKAMPKDVEAVFKALEELLQSKEKRRSTLEFLPVLYSGFLKSYKETRDTQTGLHLFIHLCKLMGLDQLSSEVTKGQRKIKAHEVLTLRRLLQVAVDYEVYDVTVGTSSELPWLQALAALLLSMSDSEKSKSWYESLRLLVYMDHMTIELRLRELLIAVWVNACKPDTEDAQTAQDVLLAELVMLYGRLRRIPVFLNQCLKALREKSNAIPNINWPMQFINSFISVFNALQPSSCATLWKTILTEITSHYLAEDQTKCHGFIAVIELLNALIGNARLVDYSVPQQVAAQVLELLEVTLTDVVNVVLLKHFKQNSSWLGPVLLLMETCGEFRLLLVQFTSLTLNADILHAEGPNVWYDFSILNPGVSTKKWEKILKSADKQKDYQALYLMDKLANQKLRAILILEQATSQSHRDASEIIASYLLNHFITTKSDDQSHAWNKQISDITESNYMTARLDIVCRNLPLLIFAWTEQEIHDFVRFIITLVQDGECEDLVSEGHVTINSLANEMFASDTWNELRRLQGASVYTLIGPLALQHPALPSPKKKKRKSVGRAGSQPLLGELMSDGKPVQSVSTEELNEKTKVVASHVLNLFTSNDFTLDIGDNQEMLKSVKMLSRLPMNYFTPVNKNSCILGFLALTRSNRSELVSAGLNQLALVLDSADVMPLIRQLDSGVILLHLLDTAADDKDLASREAVLFNLLKQATKDLECAQKLEPFITKCCHILDQTRKRSEISLGQQSMVRKSLATLKSVIERARQDPALHSLCMMYYTRLTSTALKVTNKIIVNAKGESQNMTACVHALQCFRHALDHECLLLRRYHQAQEKLKREKEVEEMEVDHDKDSDSESVSSSEDSNTSGDKKYSTKEESDSLNQELTIEKLPDDSELESETREIAAKLYTQIQPICDILLSTMQNGHDSLLMGSCLPLVSTICTNYKYLKHHIADDKFCHIALVLVFRRLHSDKGTESTEEVKKILSESHEPSKWEKGCHNAEDGEASVTSFLRQTLVAIMASLNNDEFSQTLYQLLVHVTEEQLRKDARQVASSLHTLQELLDARLDDTNAETLKYACQNVLMPIMELLSACQMSTGKQKYKDVILTSLSTISKMLSFGPSLLSSRTVSICLHASQYVPLDDVTDLSDFNAYHQRAYGLLNVMLVHHEKTVFNIIPAFLHATKRLMVSTIVQSDQSRPGLTADDSAGLVNCALRIYRLYSLISIHKVHFAKVAPYMVADYIESVQRVTVLPKVKKTLVGAIYKIMDLCDEHAVRLLSTVLPPSGKEIYRTIHNEYLRYYRYKGRI